MPRQSTHRGRNAGLLLLVCALHVLLGWVLLTTGRMIRLRRSPSLELIMLAPVREPAVNRAPETASPPTAARIARRPTVPESAAATAPTGAVTPSVDWNKELARAARAASGLDAPQGTKDFGAPVRPPTTADYPQFDWDYARTHRVETIPSGGVVVHLNDNCVLVLAPFPLALCSPFKLPANGDLFKHMRDPDKPGDARIP